MTNDPMLGHWAAGLIDGEGSLQIYRHRTRFRPCFEMMLRLDDRPALERARCATGELGTVVIRRSRPGPGSKPCAVWRVSKRAELRQFLGFLEAYPLCSRKAVQLPIFRAAVFEWERLAEDGRPYDWTEMSRLKEELKRVRRYPD